MAIAKKKVPAKRVANSNGKRIMIRYSNELGEIANGITVYFSKTKDASIERKLDETFSNLLIAMRDFHEAVRSLK